MSIIITTYVLNQMMWLGGRMYCVSQCVGILLV